MSIERTWNLDEAFNVVRRAYPYARMPRSDFDAIIEYLAGGGRVLGSYESYGKIVVENGSVSRCRTESRAPVLHEHGRDQRRLPGEGCRKGNRRLGEVEESFLGALQPGDAFIMAAGA